MERDHLLGSVLVGVAWVASSFALAPVVGAFPPVSVAQQIIFLTPGWIATPAIETFRSAAQPLLVVAVCAVLVVVLASFTYWYVRNQELPREPRPHTTVATAGLLYLLTVWLFSLDIDVPVAVGASLPVAGASVSVYYLLFGDRSPEGNEDRSATRSDGMFARRALVSVLSLAVTVALRYPLQSIRESETSASRDPVSEKREAGRTVGATDTGSNGGGEGGTFDFGTMPRRLTPTKDHYIVDIDVDDPAVDVDSWTLTVNGAVDDPYDLSYEALRNHDSVRNQVVTLLCISNYVGGPLISTGRWRGVPLGTLVDAAGPTDGAVDVVTHAVDGYSEALPLEEARRQGVLVAFGVNGGELPRSHGYPARLLVPGRYGMKSTKWLTRIEVAPREHDSYWEQRGWDEEAVVNTVSYIRSAERRGDTVLVGGVAYAGLRGVDTVEVSFDDGSTWQTATLESALSPYAWRRWRYALDRPENGILKVTARAVDGEGTVQTSAESDPHPGGSTGWHQTTFRL